MEEVTMLSDEIRRLHELHQAGALSDAEFAQAKARLLSGTVNLDKTTAGAGFAAQLNALRRSRTQRMLAGVCGGLAQVTSVDAWVWRLLFALFTLMYGIGAVAYLLLWVFVPEEQDKLPAPRGPET
jgi:phage shock protein C